MPNNPRNKILVIDDDLNSLDLIKKQVLEPLGHAVLVATDATTALQQAISKAPEVVILSLSVHGLSGRDILTALRSQSFDAPIIVIVPENGEAQALTAFRLGARDYLVRPLREAEIVATVDRVLEDGRLRRERSSLQHQLTQANADLEHRLRELTTLSSIGKAVVNLSDVGSLFNRILESALLVTSAEMGWMVLTDEGSDQTLLVGAKNFPGRVQLLQPWDDGLIPLVKVSGEPLNLSGAGLASLKIGQITKAVLAVPLKAREQTIGVLTVAHKTAQPFTDRHTVLLNAVADYASIAIVNMRLFEALEGRARSMQQAYEELQAGDKRRNEVMWKLSQALRGPVGQAKSILDLNLTEIGAKLKEQQRTSLKNASDKLTEAWQMLEDLAIVHEPPRATTPTLKPVKLDELARQSLAKHQPLAQQNNITLLTSIAAPVIVPGDQARLLRIFDCLIGNAIKFSLKGSEVVVSLAKENGLAQVAIADRGIGIPAEHLPHIFERFYQVDPSNGGAGMGLSLVKQIVEAHGGQVWAESTPGQGSRFYFTLPKAT